MLLDPEEKHYCAHCGAEVHPEDRWCRNCDGILTDEYKAVEVTYTQEQIAGWAAVAGITAALSFLILHYILGWV